ncbi:MAG TPA: hypothetical protein VK753_10875 [Xanthomonadaceae bacterium]|nr:hypothetical protein [Xanthomonadaceae bacterium]
MRAGAVGRAATAHPGAIAWIDATRPVPGRNPVACATQDGGRVEGCTGCVAKDVGCIGKDTGIAAKEDDIATIDVVLAAKDDDFATIDVVVAAKDDDIAAIDVVVAAKDDDIATIDVVVAAKDDDIATIGVVIAAKDDDIVAIDVVVAAKDHDVAPKDDVFARNASGFFAIRDGRAERIGGFAGRGDVSATPRGSVACAQAIDRLRHAVPFAIRLVAHRVHLVPRISIAPRDGRTMVTGGRLRRRDGVRENMTVFSCGAVCDVHPCTAADVPEPVQGCPVAVISRV